MQSETEKLIDYNYDMKLWEMRHCEVSKYAATHNIKRVADFGCSEGELITRLSRSEIIEHLVGIDFDCQVLKLTKNNVVKELMQQDLQLRRTDDQVIQIFRADLTKQYQELKQMRFEMVAFIQVIQHLPLNDIEPAINNIFGFLHPEHVFITTPNSEYNVHFKFSKGQMRHDDHKFQWTRQEFQLFCEKVEKQFNYSFQIIGIGQHPTDKTKGCCTQGAVFRKRPQPSEGTQDSNKTSSKETEELHLELIKQIRNVSWKNNIEKLVQSFLFKIIRSSNKNRITWQESINQLRENVLGKKIEQESQVKICEQYIKNQVKNEKNLSFNEKGFGSKMYTYNFDRDSYDEVEQQQQSQMTFSSHSERFSESSDQEPKLKGRRRRYTPSESPVTVKQSPHREQEEDQQW